MIQSMTAFARGEKKDEYGYLTCELRSINHRYLEISLSLPDVLRSFEMLIRERIREFINRGKIDVTFKYQPQAHKNGLFKINTDLARELCLATERISTFLPKTSAVNPMDILRHPGVLETEEVNQNQLKVLVATVLENTLKDLINTRGREGKELKQLFLQRIDLIQGELAKVRAHLPQIQNDQRERLSKRFAEINVEFDPNRLEQEMVIFAQKTDVAEELERTETHISELRRILKEGGTVGRRLDFLLQELNREANTLGAKSVNSTLTHAAVEMKVLIEQMREQVQNIE